MLWLFKLSFAKCAGGQTALEALKRCVAGLVAQYGEPTYAGSCCYKGEAYARFARADIAGGSEGRIRRQRVCIKL